MVHSKTVILAAICATAVAAVPSNGETNQVRQGDEATSYVHIFADAEICTNNILRRIEAREPML